jgi:SAM-dependent methyltransferase
MNHDPAQLTFAAGCAKRLLLASQTTRFRGVGGYSVAAFATKGGCNPFPQASTASSQYRQFFEFFQGTFDVESEIRDKAVLDFGSGYGGRTVDYARLGRARFVWGVEPGQVQIDLSRQYAESLNVTNVDFRVCGETSVPLPDQSVDVVVSYDVLEHVASPPISVAELYRVLKPGGTALLVFPVYLGMFSHHLDYMTLLPGLHWVFSAETLVNAVNSILRSDQGMTRFGTREQPAPRKSFDNRRYVLPLLNGLSSCRLHDLFERFSVLSI